MSEDSILHNRNARIRALESDNSSKDATIQSLTTANAKLTAQLAEARSALEGSLCAATHHHEHLYQGACPDEVEGPDASDTFCPICAKIAKAKQALSRTPSDALARYRALERVAEAAKRLLAGDWSRIPLSEAVRELRELEATNHA